MTAGYVLFITLIKLSTAVYTKAPESNICVSGRNIQTVSNTESAAADLPEQEGNYSAGWFHTLL